MSQRSITSFFSKLPSKTSQNNGVSSNNLIVKTPEDKPKRPREPSSGDKNVKTKKSKLTTPKSAETKKNAKRQKSNENLISPKLFANDKTITKKKTSLEKDESPKIDESPEKDELIIRTPASRKKRNRRIIESDTSEDEEVVKDSTKLKTESNDEESKKVNGNENKDANCKKDNKKNGDSNLIKPEIKNESEIKEESPEKEIKKVEKKGVSSFFNVTPKNDTENKSKTEFNPISVKYDPIESATWKRGEKVPYMALARTLEEIENISARLKIIEILSNYLRSVIVLTPEDLLPSIYLCLNKLAPAYEGLEVGVADTSLYKAIAQSTGRTVAQIKADAKEAGDVGIVAEQSKTNQRMIFQPAPLNIRGVFVNLKNIAQMSGNASQTKKVEKIQSMFVACKGAEARFLIRSLAGKLRIGLAEQSVLQALALACALTPPNQEYPPKILNARGKNAEAFKEQLDELALILKTTYCECPNYNLIIPVLLKEGIRNLPNHCKLSPGIPLKPMLAHPTKGVQEVLDRFDGLKFTCEWKYDGERAQIHIGENGEVHIYSRNQEDNTSKYPDIISRLDNCKMESVKSCILDCEAVAWDKEKKQILPFQILSTRKRKDANEADIKVQVCVFMFDLLYLNNESLVRKPFSERRALLTSHFKEYEGQWCFATSMDTKTMEEVQEFLEESVKGNCEGLMVKTLDEDATYEIAKRSRNWLKLKKDYLEGVGDTLDVVVIGGYLGKGKRTGTYGGFLLACYDTDNEEYQSICKVGTGFSDENLKDHAEFLKNHVIPQPKSYYRYDTSHEPDHWFDAVQVWEIKCADLSLSPAHRAAIGIVDSEKGISLRFPRFVRIREDKSVEEATSAQQIADMYSNQDQIKNQQGSGSKIMEEDLY